MRPLYDDGASDPSAVTRDYVLKLDAGDDGRSPPVLSIFGGKLTTYRRLAEHALDELAPFFPAMNAPWTHAETLPGGDLPASGVAAWVEEMQRRYHGLSAAVVRDVVHRHGSCAPDVLGNANSPADLGEDFGNGLYAREVDYLVRNEWARTADDVLWRRTKCALGMPEPARTRVAAFVVADDRGAHVTRADAAARKPFARDARRDSRRSHRHRRHADDAWTAHRRRLRRARASLRARANSWSRSPAAPPDGATTSRACGRSTRSSARTARSGCATTHGAASSMKRFLARRGDRRANRARLAAIGDKILARGARAALASDQLYREADLAIDFREDVARLPRAAIDRIVGLMEAEGMTAKVSSIHVNGWFGAYDKLDDDAPLFAESLRRRSRRGALAFVFVGDSPNDAPMFAFFPNSVRRRQRARVRRPYADAAGIRHRARGRRPASRSSRTSFSLPDESPDIPGRFALNALGHTDIVTNLFTDIESSTHLWEQDPERMSRALAGHDTLLRAVVRKHHGTLVKMTGDGMHAVFVDPVDALDAAMAAQTALTDPAATHGVPLQVRCGLHVGVVERRRNDYFGTAVNRAARIMGAAHGGQTLLSQAVVELLRDRLPPNVTLRDLGSVRLRDLASPEHVYQILHPRLRADFPALRSLEGDPQQSAAAVVDVHRPRTRTRRGAEAAGRRAAADAHRSWRHRQDAPVAPARRRRVG